MSLKQIARETGVAMSTVSRALNGHPHVDEHTRARVQEVADRLGYRPSVAARALRGSGTRTVGVVLPDMMNHFYARTVSMLQDQLEDRGYGVVLAVTNNDANRERAALDRLAAADVDGIIIVPSIVRLPPKPVGIPIVELNRESSRDCDKVCYDEADGAYSLVTYLTELGHRSIAMVGGEASYSTTRRRAAGYQRALSDVGVEMRPEWQQIRTHSREWGAEALRRLMALPEPPTAVFASSSELVLGLLVEARRLGLQVPHDLSFVAFGDPEWYEVVAPEVTSYEQPINQTASIAVQLLANRMSQGTQDAPTKVVVQGRVMMRNSAVQPPEKVRKRSQ